MNNFLKNIQFFFGINNKPKRKIKAKKKKNIVSFFIDEWNRPSIKMDFELQTDYSLSEFGKLLYLINSGKYEKHILDYMVENSHQNPFLKDTIQKTLLGWASCVKDNIESNNDAPYIKPTEVFKHGNIS